MIGPTDLLHPSPAPHFKTFQVTNLITAQNYFKFQDKTFLQTDGLAMGAPTSSVLSELYLQYLENTTIFDILFKFKILGYFRYVDDILIVYNQSHTDIEEVQSTFNNITPKLKFTLERETENELLISGFDNH